MVDYSIQEIQFLAQVHNSFPLTRFEPMRLAVLRLLVKWVISFISNKIGTIKEFVNPELFCCQNIRVAIGMFLTPFLCY